MCWHFFFFLSLHFHDLLFVNYYLRKMFYFVSEWVFIWLWQCRVFIHSFHTLRLKMTDFVPCPFIFDQCNNHCVYHVHVVVFILEHTQTQSYKNINERAALACVCGSRRFRHFRCPIVGSYFRNIRHLLWWLG